MNTETLAQVQRLQEAARNALWMIRNMHLEDAWDIPYSGPERRALHLDCSAELVEMWREKVRELESAAEELDLVLPKSVD